MLYLSTTKFADWLRGTPKPHAATFEEWEAWRIEAKRSHPIRYWLAEKALGQLDQALCWPERKLNNIKYYLRNRFVIHSHRLTARPSHIKPGEWAPLGDRMVSCLFNELQNHVEIDLAMKNVQCDPRAREKFKPPFWGLGWFRTGTWRCPQAGLDYLEWEAGLTQGDDHGLPPGDPDYNQPTPQAATAQEILLLYKWWTQVYLQRPPAENASGWTAWHEQCEAQGLSWWGSRSDLQYRAESHRLHEEMRRIEGEYALEDEVMLIRLVRIRQGLWS